MISSGRLYCVCDLDFRCTDLDEVTVQMYQATVVNLGKRDRLTMCEIMVARLISCSVDTATLVNGK